MKKVFDASALKAVAFDCDGVMFDSSQANQSFYNTILEHMGRPPLTSSQVEYAHMHTVDEVLAHLVGGGEDYARAHQCRRAVGYDRFISEMTMEPDLTEVLQWLRPTYKTAIATNRTNTMQTVMGIFGLEAHFDLVVTASDVARPKPDPQMLLKILETLDFNPRELLYIGDSQLDAQAALAAGVWFAAFRNPGLEAHLYLDTLSQIKGELNHHG